MSNTLNLGNGDWATKENSLLGYNSENGNYKPLPFDFTRASNATFVNKSGLIETAASGVPRIDFLGNTSGALKLEPQSTNLIAYSEDFSQWSQTRVINTDNEITSPDGSLNASLITEDSTLDSKYTFLTPTVTINEHTLSFFGKYKGRYLQVLFGTNDVSGNPYINFDLQNGIFDNNGVTNPSIEFFGNGWYKCSLTVTSAVTTGFGVLFSTIPSLTSSRLTSYQGDGTSGVYLWGAQLEQGSYPTSYIKTEGSAVTRVRDLSDTQNLSNVIGQTEGVIFYDAILVHKSTDTSEDLFELSIDDGSNQNIFFINNYNNSFTIGMLNGGTYQFTNNSFNPTEGARYKLAFAYKQNDFALYINGNQIATDSSGTVPSMNQITFGNYYNNQSSLSNSVKVNNLKLYNTRLSNAELVALTTI